LPGIAAHRSTPLVRGWTDQYDPGANEICSFLKKQGQAGGKYFFFERKTQKTFNSGRFAFCRPGPGSFHRSRIKSLLILFFRKELAFLNLKKHLILE
jgi:hypothetical protein